MCATHSAKPDAGSHDEELGAGDNQPRSFAARSLLAAVGFYQRYVSPLKMGSTCRFEPTCSAYALDAIRARGALLGALLTVIRIAKCGPWHPGGYDPPPQPHRTR